MLPRPLNARKAPAHLWASQAQLSAAQRNAHAHTHSYTHTHTHTGKSLLVRPCLFWPLFNFICFAFIFVFIAVTNYVQQFDHPSLFSLLLFFFSLLPFHSTLAVSFRNSPFSLVHSAKAMKKVKCQSTKKSKGHKKSGYNNNSNNNCDNKNNNND